MLGRNNIAIGDEALSYNRASDNIAIGVFAMLSNTTGTANVAIGGFALQDTNGEFNTAVGHSAGLMTGISSYNTALGASALGRATGNRNVAIGYSALINNGGSDNTASGANALYTNVSGSYNNASGSEALYFNTTGSGNVATGRYALRGNTLGNQNTAIGEGAMTFSFKGSENTAIGSTALYNNGCGSFNSAFGSNALNKTYSTCDGSLGKGSYNTGIGHSALSTNRRGSYNTALGYGADVPPGASGWGWSNATAIGNGALANASNKIRLGNADVTVIEGQVAFSNASDRRLKKDIMGTRYGLNTILKLRPVDYQMKSNNLEQIGFIAQELRPIVPEAVSGIEGDLEKGETLGVAYTTLIPVLTKAIQEQQALIEAQNKVIQQLQKDVLILKQK